MEIRYYIDVAQETIILKFSGRLTYDRWYRGASAVWDNRDYQKHFDGIVDFRESELDMATPDIKKIVEVMKTEEDKAPRGTAVILVSEPLAAAFGTIFSDNMKGTFPANVVVSEEDALSLLKVNESLFKKVKSEEAEVIQVPD